jgi:hypothetical protein
MNTLGGKMKSIHLRIATGLLTAGLMGQLVLTVQAEEAQADNLITQAGVVKVEWQDPSRFRDIKTSSGIQSRYEERLFDSLTKELDKNAQRVLKDNQTLELVVTDLDLAGDMRPTFGAASVSELRIVKDLYPPRMTFTYRVLEGSKVIMIGDEKLIDMNFLHHVGMSKNSTAEYESKMLADWLKKTIAPKV